MLNRHGVIAIAAVISPYRNARAKLRESIPGFIEVYVKTPLAVCIRRDVKGMYAKAMTGEIAHFTGLHDPYEEPLDPDIVVETENQSIICCVNLILKFLHDKGLMVGNVVVAEDS
jgi:adenylylsulfate kinase